MAHILLIDDDELVLRDTVLQMLSSTAIGSPRSPMVKPGCASSTAASASTW